MLSLFDSNIYNAVAFDVPQWFNILNEYKFQMYGLKLVLWIIKSGSDSCMP
jgi:hypothetical protein